MNGWMDECLDFTVDREWERWRFEGERPFFPIDMIDPRFDF